MVSFVCACFIKVMDARSAIEEVVPCFFFVAGYRNATFSSTTYPRWGAVMPNGMKGFLCQN